MDALVLSGLFLATVISTLQVETGQPVARNIEVTLTDMRKRHGGLISELLDYRRILNYEKMTSLNI